MAVSPAAVYVVSIRSYQATAAARVPLEKLQNALASVRFVAAQPSNSAEAFAAATADLHCCSSIIVHNDKESWRRLMRAELRDRKLLARSALTVSFPAGQTTHAVSLICDLVYMSQCELGHTQTLRSVQHIIISVSSLTVHLASQMLTHLVARPQAMFGSNVDSPDVVHVTSSVKLSGVGEDLLLCGSSATLLASADSVQMDFDKMSTNAGAESTLIALTWLARVVVCRLIVIAAVTKICSALSLGCSSRMGKDWCATTSRFNMS